MPSGVISRIDQPTAMGEESNELSAFTSRSLTSVGNVVIQHDLDQGLELRRVVCKIDQQVVQASQELQPVEEPARCDRRIAAVHELRGTPLSLGRRIENERMRAEEVFQGVAVLHLHGGEHVKTDGYPLGIPELHRPEKILSIREYCVHHAGVQ